VIQLFTKQLKARNEVNIMDFLCALVTFSNSNWTSKVKFIFQLFDFNSSGGISYDEMVILGGCWVRGICCANQTTYPTMGKLNTIMKVMFAEADSTPDRHVTMDEMIRWVAHCDEVVAILKIYEPQDKVGVHASILSGMHDSILEERKLAKRRTMARNQRAGKT
jgi:hypothetical protein